MLLREWNMDEAIAVAKEEALEEAAKSMLKEGLKPALVARVTQLPKEQIMALKRA